MVAGVVIAGAAGAEIPPASTVPSPQAAASSVEQLPNSMSVTTIANHRIPLVAIDICYGVGGANDPPESPGLANAVGWLIEQAPTRHVGRGESSRLMQAAGFAWTRHVSVGPDDTHVSIVVPSRAVELALWMEAERMGFQADATDAYLTQLATDFSFARWKNEREAAPEDMGDILERAVAGPTHPYFIERAPIKITPDALRKRLRSFYTPGNGAIAIVGDVAAEEARKLVDKYFGVIPGVPASDLPQVTPSPWAHELRILAGVDLQQVAIGWPTPGYEDPDDVALDVGAHLLNVRLRDRLVDHDKVVERIVAGEASKRRASVFAVGATLTDMLTPGERERPADLVIDAVDDELDHLRSNHIDPSVLVRAKREALLGAVDECDGLAARAKAASRAARFIKRTDSVEDLTRRYREVDGAKVSDAVKKNLVPDRRVVLRVIPDRRRVVPRVEPEEPARTFRPPVPEPAASPRDGMIWYRPPARGAPTTFLPPEIASAQGTHGARILVSSRSDVPSVRFRFSLQWPEKRSAANGVVSRLLPAALVGGKPLEARLAALGTKSEFGSNMDELYVSVEAVPEAVVDALRAVFDAVRRPQFPSEAFEKVIQKRTNNLAAAPGDASTRMWDLVAEKLLPATHRAHSDRRRDIVETKALRLRDLERYLQTLASAEALSVSFVGDIDAKEARRAVDAADPGAGKQPAHVRMPPTPTNQELLQGDHFVDDDRADRAALLFLCPLGRRGTTEYAAAEGLAWFFQTAAEEPTMKELHVIGKPDVGIRESRDTTLFYLQLVVRSDRGTAAIQAVLRSANSVKTRLFSPSGLGEIHGDLLESLEDQYDKVSDEAELVGELARFGLGRDAIVSTAELVSRLDSSSIQGAAQLCFGPSTLRVVGYGNVREAADELKSRGYGPVEISVASEGRAK